MNNVFTVLKNQPPANFWADDFWVMEQEDGTLILDGFGKEYAALCAEFGVAIGSELVFKNGVWGIMRHVPIDQDAHSTAKEYEQ